MEKLESKSKPTKRAQKAKTAASVANGYTSPFADNLEGLVDFEDENTAYLEVEKREFSQANGKKVSKPRIVSFNRRDLVSFNRTIKEGEGKDAVEVCDGREMIGQVNAVWHVPKKWNIAVKVDEWED